MKKRKTERQKFDELAKLQPVNDPAKAGQLAAGKVLLPSGSRYAVAPVHTRFDAVQWFTWDAEQVDPVTDGPAVVRQAATFAEAVAGL